MNRILADIATRSGSADQKIAWLADEQFGRVARWQLRVLGIKDGAVARRVAAGRLHRRGPGVYAVGHSGGSARATLMEAVLGYGPHALASHASALALRSVIAWQRPLHVSVPRGASARPGIKVHQARRLQPRDRDLVGGIPATSVARALLEHAGQATEFELRRAWEELDRAGLLRLAEIDDVCSRGNGCSGVAALRALRREALIAPETRSELERLFLELIRAAGLPEPAMNVLVEGFLVDAVWFEQRVVIELDGFGYHRHRAQFERDYDRDQALRLAGFEVHRVSWKQLRERPDLVIEVVRRLLSR